MLIRYRHLLCHLSGIPRRNAVTIKDVPQCLNFASLELGTVV